MIVVGVLIMSCHVSISTKKKVEAQITTISTHATKNQPRDTNWLLALANLSKPDNLSSTCDGSTLSEFSRLGTAAPHVGGLGAFA